MILTLQRSYNCERIAHRSGKSGRSVVLRYSTPDRANALENPINLGMIENIIEHFESLPDPRREHPNTLHKLIDIVVIALCATIAKADTWEEIEDYGNAKEGFLSQFLELPHGIPSHDTFNRVFARLNPDAWQSCFTQWMASIGSSKIGELIAIDGKTLRASKATGTGKSEEEQAALVMLSAWASERQIVLDQLPVDDKKNEISVIPSLLSNLDLEGATVSIDAMGCQKAIAKQIIKQGGDYLLSLKANQEDIYQEANWLFSYNREEQVPMEHAESFDVAHGREETRSCWLIKDLRILEDTVKDFDAWHQLTSIIVIDSQVIRKGKTTCQRRFFLSSLDGSAKDALHKVRTHWSIENQQHYPLDIVFHEDANRTRKGFAAQNLAVLRRLALNLINLHPQPKVSKRRKRFKALLDDDYLLQVLGVSLPD